MDSMRDLRDWLKEIDRLGELKRISAEVDWDLEMAGISYVTGKKLGSPALMFENIKGYPKDRKVLFNVLGSSLNRIALAMRLPAGKSALELIQLVRQKHQVQIPPEIVDSKSAPINENIQTGDDIDLYTFPTPWMWPLDGGRYIGTGDIVITRDPDDGWHNLGTYRQMIHSKNEVGFYISPGKDGLLHREAWWKQGKPCEVAVVYGVDPLLFIVGSTGFAKNVSEYDFAGGLQGRPIEVVKGKVTDLLIPARAEIVIEGVAYPGKLKDEGPFGEFTGYYGRPAGQTPVIDVKCVHFRNDPILTCALMADHPSCEQSYFISITRSAKIWDDLSARMGIPGIKGVYCVPAAVGGFGMVVVSMEQRYAGHAQQVAALAAQCAGGAYINKFTVIVDEDVDPTDLEQVVWAMASRCNPIDDIDILRNTWSTPLDPAQNPPEKRPYASKALVYACKDHRFLKTFSKRTMLTEDTYKRVEKRWRELGLDGEAPKITNFETQPRKKK